MSGLPTSPTPRSTPLSERLQPWAAALVSALLHLLMVLLLLHSNPPVVSTPQGSAGGGRVKVDFVGQAAPATQVTQTPPRPTLVQTPRPPAKQAARRQSDARKPVLEAKFIEPPPAQETAKAEDAPSPETAPASAAATGPTDTAQRQPRTWSGRPPGLLEKPANPDDTGRSASQGNQSGRLIDRSGGEPAMQVGGYQIIYDLLSEEKLRAWMAGAKEVNGKKELSIPLPGTTYLMVCPAEVALRRGSSKCRMLEAGSPELQDIGDARDFVIVMYVYRYGELLWRGPGPYR